MNPNPEIPAAVPVAEIPAAVPAERPHHPYSPSKLGFLEWCPCFDNRQGTVHVAAIAGQRQHAVTETGEDDARLDDDEATAAAECIDFYEKRRLIFLEARTRAVHQLAEELTAASVNAGRNNLEIAHDQTPQLIELTETYLPVDDEEARLPVRSDPDGPVTGTVAFDGTTAGYIDRGLIDHTRTIAELFDWKFGQWAVDDATENLQGISYVLGMFRRIPTLERITFFFKQPALHSISQATFTRDQIPALLLRIRVVVANATAARFEGDFRRARPGVPACLFCANVGKCPKVTEFACKVGPKFSPLVIPESITPTYVLDPKQAAFGMQLASVLETWAKSFRTQTTDRAIRTIGKTMPDGYKFETRSDREIADPKLFKAITLKHLTADELEAAASYTFGPLEELISERTPRGQKTAAVKAYQQELESSGAVKRGQPYTFLRADTTKKT